MKDIYLFYSLQRKKIHNQINTWKEHSRLKITVISSFAFTFFISIFIICYRGFYFFEKHIPFEFFTVVLNYLFSLFFFTLFLMLTFSSTIIAFSVFFQAKDTRYLVTCPLDLANIFFYKFAENFTFAGWAVFFLSIPICYSFGMQQAVNPIFYPLLLILLIPFVIIPTVIGSLLAFFIVLYLLKYKRIIYYLFSCIFVAGGGALVYFILTVEKTRTPSFTGAWFFQNLSYLKFTHFVLLPSVWTNKAMLALANENYKDFFFYIGVLFSTAIFLYNVAYIFVGSKYNKAWDKFHSFKNLRKILYFSWLNSVLKVLFFLNPRERKFLEKDIRVFARDVAQWGQFAILIGLLLLYILNLRTFEYDQKSMFWKHFVATLNLSSIALINCTFATRFIFPMLSLEGKKFWMLGVMPIKKSSILASKFLFATIILIFTSETLVLLSCYMLKLPPTLVLFHSCTILAISLGVASLSVGIGAIYPNFKEDTLSKIIAGFEGTLNLILNIAFVLIMVTIQSIPGYLLLKGIWTGSIIYYWMAVTSVITLIVVILPMYIGNQSFKNLEF